MSVRHYIINNRESILITGANGFIGSKVVKTLLQYGFRNIHCFVRPSSNMVNLDRIIKSSNNSNIKVIKGNLLSLQDCEKATEGVSVIYHLAAGMEKTLPGAYMNSVVTTRNLMNKTLKLQHFKRLVNVSSFTVYSNTNLKAGALLDEQCEVEYLPETRGEAYCYGKVKQDELVIKYHKKYKLPYVIVRPGVVYGPGKSEITGRIGIRTFGMFLHLGGSNRIPLTYVDNCADAIVLAGLKKGVEGQTFNIVDDDLPTSREFLRMYKKNVENFTSICVPKILSFCLCYLWEKYSPASEGESQPKLNRKRWSAEWKGNRYSNEKIKDMLGWKPKVFNDEGLKRYFEYCRKGVKVNG